MTIPDGRLGRRVEFDERSKEFPIRKLVPAVKKPRSYTWSCATNLEQGPDQCVGFAWAHELAARPMVNKVVGPLGVTIYDMAQKLDEWRGEDYGGTSVLAGAKAVKELGYMSEYRWGFSLSDMIDALGYVGPAVLGINWYAGMDLIDSNGFIHPDGKNLGGHAILCYSVNVTQKYFKLHNSWGTAWGTSGRCKVHFRDMEQLLSEQGECCFPVGRKKL